MEKKIGDKISKCQLRLHKACEDTNDMFIFTHALAYYTSYVLMGIGMSATKWAKCIKDAQFNHEKILAMAMKESGLTLPTKRGRGRPRKSPAPT